MIGDGAPASAPDAARTADPGRSEVPGGAAQSTPDVVPAPTPDARTLFGDRLPVAMHYAELLVGDAVRRGFLGPREADRIWDRHLVNCALAAVAFPLDARVVDVGSGAGLPGLALACLRPDLRIDLVDSLHRRTRFLTEAVAELGFSDRVRVITGRAEDKAVRSSVGRARWVTARAVAPLERLVGWCLPLLAADGELVAFKGAGAQDELDRSASALRRFGAGSAALVEYGRGVVAEPTITVHVRRR